MVKGDDGRDFITVEYCGDDFLAALADFDKGTEEWDDIQALETEAQGTLAEMFEKANSCDNGFDTDDDDSREDVHVKGDSPETKRNPEVMEVDSSSDLEDDDKRTQTSSTSHPLRSMVRFNIAFTVSFVNEGFCLVKTPSSFAFC